MKNEIAVLVVSCDKYKDTWLPFFDLLSNHWRGLDINVYLGNNFENFTYIINNRNVKVINIGTDLAWTNNYKKMLNLIKEDYIITFLDDFFIVNEINNDHIKDLFKIVKKENIDCLTLSNYKQGKGKYKSYADLKEIYYDQEYIVNSGVNIWKKEVLKTFLKSNYSAWEFEIRNSYEINNRLSPFEFNFVSIKKPVFKILNGVIMGKWVPKTINFLKRKGYSFDTSKRNKLTFKEANFESLKGFIRSMMPKRLRKFIKIILIKLGFRKWFVSAKYLK
jgi:hypothetical protein